MFEHGSLVGFIASTDIEAARSFYVGALGLAVIDENPFALVVDGHGATVRITKVDDAVVAPYTVLGWEVDDIATTVAQLAAAGIAFERFPGMTQDDAGVWEAPGGARVAWFKDPEGHVLSVTQQPAP